MEALIDLDGVLADFHRHFLDTHRVSDPYELEENKGRASFLEYCGFSPETVNLDKEWWATMPPTKEAFEIVELLSSHFDSLRVISTPFPYNTGASVDGKLLWLEQHFPQLRDGYIFTINKSISSTALLVDDYEPNTRSYKGSSILLPRPWNSNYKYLDRYTPVEFLIEGLINHVDNRSNS